MQIDMNKIYLPYVRNESRYEIIYGGSGSGKSHFVAQKKVLQHATTTGRKTLVVRKVGKTIRHSCYALISQVINEVGLNHWFSVSNSKTDFDIKAVNGNQFIFTGLDDVEKLKSITGITDIWIEEATEISEDDFKQIDLRLRGETKHAKQITMTFNPISALSWLKSYFFDVQKENVKILKTTYLDNKFIDAEYKQVLEDLKFRDYVYYQIYALGEWGVLGNLIFTNYQVKDFSFDDGVIYQGIDFGFNDPSAFVKVGLKDDELYIIQELYRKGLTNNELIEEMLEVADKRKMLTADAAEPDRIKEFRQRGFNIRPADKGAGSVKAGLDFLKRRKINIHPDCTNFLKEIQGYKYREDKDGNVFDEPIDINNHLMDALRYAIENLRKDRHLKVGKNIY